MSNKVLVFKDLKNNRWTLWSHDRKTHLGYRKNLALKNCKFVVIESKRKQVLKSGKKFPHAWIIGELTTLAKKNNKVSYSPFKDKNFKVNQKTIKQAKYAFFNSKGSVFI